MTILKKLIVRISKECEKKVVSVSFKFCLAPIYHYQVHGINFGIDVRPYSGYSDYQKDLD